MPLLAYSAEDYLAQFQRLLPRGRVWHRGLGLVEDADLLALMPSWVSLTLRLNQLIADIFPCTTNQLLPEWEATLGLPDPCVGALATIQERVAAVCGKFSARGGQSKDYFIALAAALGFTITIMEFQPFRAGINRAGDPVYGEAWANTWRVYNNATTIVWFRAGLSAAGEPLRIWGNHLVECILTAAKPAHTILQFAYISIWDGGASVWDAGASEWDAPHG